MKRLHAFLLIWLMLTVPLQAMAGKILLCESMHAPVSVSAQATAPLVVDGPHAVHDHEATAVAAHVVVVNDYHGASHLHEHSLADHPADQAGMSDESNVPEKHAGSCSVCASCPMGALGIVIAEFRIPQLDLPSANIAYLTFHIPDAVPDLPDNPPRA